MSLMTSGSTGRREIVAGKRTSPISQKEKSMSEAKFNVGFPEPLYPEDPDRCITQTIEWWSTITRGKLIRFEHDDRSYITSNVHCDDDINVDTFQTTGSIALRFGEEHRVWFPKSRAVEIANALLWEAAQAVDTNDRKEVVENGE